MEPTLGWTLLSPKALERASTYLNPYEQGVRDEIGFLSLHQGYADRFFPGTSVLQTRLRYILFVPWIYLEIAEKKVHDAPVYNQVQSAEINLAGRLKISNEDGIIGGRSFPNPTSQPAAMVYWTALQSWGILRPLRDGSFPNRSLVHQMIAQTQRLSDLKEHDEPLEYPEPIFVNLPQVPNNWKNKDKPIDFVLSDEEVDFIRRQLISVTKPHREDIPSFLAQLVSNRRNITGYDYCWNPDLLAIAGDSEDRQALINAGHAASLAAVGRAVYAALVESLRYDDGLPTEDYHREHLNKVIAIHKAPALKSDLPSIAQDLPYLQSDFFDLLESTKEWLMLSNRPLYDLRDKYAAIESRRKGLRARLPRTTSARNKRAEWQKEDLGKAAPLHYRWNIVKRLLHDLEQGNVAG